MKAMLLAAGEGQRLRPLTTFLPKPAIPFLNVPLAYYALEHLIELGVRDLAVNTFHLPQKVHSLFLAQKNKFNAIHFSDEKSLMGSGGGIGEARDFLKGSGSFLVINADEVIFPRDPEFLKKMWQQHKETNAIATLMVKDHPGVGKEFGGVWAKKNHEIEMFSKTDPNKEHLKGWHFIGPMIFSDKIFDFIPRGEVSNILYEGVTAAIAAGHKAHIFETHCDWFETGNSHDLLKATEVCITTSAGKDVVPKLWEHFAPKTQIFEHGGAKVLAQSKPDFAKVQFSGFAVLGANSKIEQGAQIENCIIGPGITIPGTGRLKNQIILDSSQIS